MASPETYLVFYLQSVFECTIQLLYPHHKGSYIPAYPKLTNVTLLYGHLHYVSGIKRIVLEWLREAFDRG